MFYASFIVSLCFSGTLIIQFENMEEVVPCFGVCVSFLLFAKSNHKFNFFFNRQK